LKKKNPKEELDIKRTPMSTIKKTKITVKKKKVRIPLPKQAPKVMESEKVYKRTKAKKIEPE